MTGQLELMFKPTLWQEDVDKEEKWLIGLGLPPAWAKARVVELVANRRRAEHEDKG